MTLPPTPPDEERIRELLRRVVDPEVGANIVDLGLVYRIDIAPGRVAIAMTMTSPACPMGEMILDDVRAALADGLPPDWQAEVALVWEPPWTPALMSERTRRNFGW
jgi:metal-sulfur cluster biosynthetic enzyme